MYGLELWWPALTKMAPLIGIIVFLLGMRSSLFSIMFRALTKFIRDLWHRSKERRSKNTIGEAPEKKVLVHFDNAIGRIKTRRIRDVLRSIADDVAKIRKYLGYSHVEEAPSQVKNLESIHLPYILDTVMQFQRIEADCTDEQISKTVKRLLPLSEDIHDTLSQIVEHLADSIDTDLVVMERVMKDD